VANANLRANFIPVVPNPRAGQVQASFDIREVGDPNAGVVPFSDNLATSATGLPFTPDTDPQAGTAVNVASFPTNTRFNKMWANWATLAPSLPREKYAKRYVDLRFATMPDGTPSPLNPTLGLPRASIVPGSEIIIGPDQRPGPNFGLPVRYTRVVEGAVGPNQYKINYVPQRDPDWVTAGILTAPQATALDIYNPLSYDVTNFVASVLTAPYRVGYLELNSNKNEPIPDGNIYASYRFQFTEPNDVVAVDYDSSQIMDVVMSIRNYAQTTDPNPQMVTVKGSANVRNFIR
jgi:hypothetical protein